MSQTAADKLADSLVPQWKDPTKIYDFNFINPNESITTGDIITLNARDQGLNNEEVRIVGLERGISGGENEFLLTQVSNPAYKTLARKRNIILAELGKEQRDSNIFMQGSGNFNSWGAGINAKTNFPLKVIFYLSATQIQDEAGNLRVNSLTVDYDIDPFQQQYGTASFDGSDPQVQNSSASTAPDVTGSSGNANPSVNGSSGNTNPSVNGSSGSNWTGSSIGSDSNTGVSCSSGSFTTVASVATTNTGDSLQADFYVKGNSGGAEDIQIALRNTGLSTATNSIHGVYQDGFRDDVHYRIANVGAHTDGSSDFVILEVKPLTGAIVLDAFLNVYRIDHTHADGSYNAASHPHTDGSYAAASHPHADGSYDINAADIDNISIGDDVGEAGSVNASSVNLYLDFWNGSAWINKHSILATGVTIDTDVDITNSGTYPDAVGYWRVRIEPITATSDFAQGIVKLKNHIDN